MVDRSKAGNGSQGSVSNTQKMEYSKEDERRQLGVRVWDLDAGSERHMGI